jgi:hypothetical protein
MSPAKRIFVVVVLSVAGLFICGIMADKGYRRFWKPFFEKMDVAFKGEEKIDILFFGNSAVHFGINPYYVDSITGVSSYNFGYGGANIVTMSMMLRGYMETHPKPKAVVFSVDHSSFWEKGEFDNHHLFFYYVNNKAVDQHLKEKGYRTWIIKIFPFLKYSYFDDYNRGTIVQGLKGSPFEKNSVTYKGFINTNESHLQFARLDADVPLELHRSSNRHAQLFHETIEYCRTNGIQMILVFPPRLYPKPPTLQQTIFMDTMLTRTVSTYNLPYRRYDDTFQFKPYHFSDNIHLNKDGATRYSVMIGSYIDSCLRASN